MVRWGKTTPELLPRMWELGLPGKFLESSAGSGDAEFKRKLREVGALPADDSDKAEVLKTEAEKNTTAA